jgi:hypothetical protein
MRIKAVALQHAFSAQGLASVTVHTRRKAGAVVLLFRVSAFVYKLSQRCNAFGKYGQTTHAKTGRDHGASIVHCHAKAPKPTWFLRTKINPDSSGIRKMCQHMLRH